jgi:hypothetical protein
MSESESEPLVTVATFNSLFHAELAQGALEEAGIESFVSDGEVVSPFSGLTGSQIAFSGSRANSQQTRGSRSPSGL